MSYHDNLRIIQQGGGSDQARAHRDGRCPQCDGEEEDTVEEKEKEEGEAE